MKKMTKMLCALLCGVLVCGAVAVATPKDNTDVAPAPRQVQAAIMNGKDPTTTETMKKGETIQLVVKQDDNSSEKQTAGSGSGNPSESESDWEIQEQQGQNVIELDPKTGIVKAKEAGEATVVKRVTGGVAACKIIVDDKTAVEKLVIKGSQDMRVGETQKLQLSIEPEQAQNDAEVTWKSDQPDILSVDETGTVTAHKSGSATITAAADNATAKLTISVRQVLTGIILKPQNMELRVGESAGIEADPIPADADLEGLTWSSSNKTVAYYKDGMIYGVRAGTAQITASVGNVTASCTVTVREAQPAPQPSTPPDSKPNHKPNNKPNNKPSTGTSGTGSTKPVMGIGSQFTYVPKTGNTFLYMPGSTVTVTEFAYTMPRNIPEAVYLTIDSKLDDIAGSIADTLSANGMQATFFVSVENLYGSDDMLRHLTGDGNSIGLLLTAEQANSGNAVALLDQANKQLSVITGMPTRLVRISGGTSGNISSETLNKLLDAGYRVWDWNTSANESRQAADASYQAVSKAIDTTGTPTVRFDGSVATDTVLRQLLPYMKYCGIPTRAIQASDNAVCNTAAG